VASTIKLLSTIEFAKKMNFGRRSAIGNFQEPAITSANLTMQAILGPPFEWRWNRQEYNWTCLDPAVVWAPSTAYALGFRLKDPNGNMQTVTSIGSAPHQSGLTQPIWSTDVSEDVGTGLTTDGNLTWTCTDIQTYVIYVPNFGWIEHGSVYDSTLNPPSWKEMQNKNSLARESALGRPGFISAHTDDNSGNIGFVLSPVPNKPYPISIHIQKKSPLFTSINQTWAPIPDEYSYVYTWGFMTLMWLFADDNRWQFANAKFVSHLLGANEGLTETERNLFLQSWQAITGVEQNTSAQGLQARGNQ